MGVLEAADAGEYDGLGAEGVAAARVQAQGAIERQEQAAAVAAEKETQRQARLVNDELAQITAISGKGRTAAQLALLDDPRVRELADPEILAEAEAARALLTEKPTLQTMTIVELEREIAAEREASIARDYQAERLTVLEGLLERKTEGLRTDPVAYARDEGLPFFDTEVAFDPADEAGFRAQLRTRVADGQAYARREELTGGFLPLSEAEKGALRTSYAAASPDERTVLARSLSAELGPQATSSITGDPVAGHVGALLAQGGSDVLAREVFQGGDAIALGNVKLPPEAERIGEIFGRIGGLFADVPGGEALEATVRKAADQLYAARARVSGASTVEGEIDADLYNQALHEVLGGTGDVNAWGDGGVRGGVQPVRDVPTILPRGVRAGDVEAALEGLGVRLEASEGAGQSGGRQRPEFREEWLQEDLARISVTGRAPRINGQPVDPDSLSRYRLEAVADGLYILTWNGRVLKDDAGADYTIRMGALLQGRRP
jgi:hypothetical protein